MISKSRAIFFLKFTSFYYTGIIFSTAVVIIMPITHEKVMTIIKKKNEVHVKT